MASQQVSTNTTQPVVNQVAPTSQQVSDDSDTDVDEEFAQTQADQQRLLEEQARVDQQIQADTAAAQNGILTPEQQAQAAQDAEEYPDIAPPDDTITPEEPDPALQDQG